MITKASLIRRGLFVRQLADRRRQKIKVRDHWFKEKGKGVKV